MTGPASAGADGIVRAGRLGRSWLVAILAGLVGVVVVALVIRPLDTTTIDPDAAASVLYFQRVVGGQRLEAFVPTTPKPLLTLVDGLTWSLLHDWRALTWETLLAFGVAVALAVRWLDGVARALVGEGRLRPIAGSAAAGFGAAALVASPDLVLEVSRANSLVWALAGWLIAGLAMAGPRRRPLIAGVALLLAGLVRFETLAIVGGAGVALTARTLLARRSGGRVAPPREEWLLLVGLLAVPIACLHDLLLTGDPLFWLGVPARYTQVYVPDASAMDPLAYGGVLAARWAAEWPLVVLALVGTAALVRSRSRAPLVALGPLVAGDIALLFALAARATYISTRYYEPLDLALTGLAALGVAWLIARVAGRVVPGGTSAARGVAVAAAAGALGIVMALGIGWPAAPVDDAVRRALDLVRTASANLEAYGSRLATLAATPGPAGTTATGSPAATPVTGAPPADPAGVAVFVPSLLRPRIAVETGARLTAIGDAYAEYLARPPWPGLHAGQWLYHDRAADRPAAFARVLEADPARLGGSTAAPILVDAARGVWILSVAGP